METIWLQRPSGDIPWGFRLQGGAEFGVPLSIQRVTPGSVASNGLIPGDILLKIGNVTATNISQVDAQDVIQGASNILQFTIKRSAASSTPVSPASVQQQPQFANQSADYNSSPYDQQDRYQTLPNYKVGNGYNGQNSDVNNSSGYNYAQENSPYDMRQYDQPAVSGYSTLPARGGGKQNNESFRPVDQQQNRYPYKSTSGITLQMNPQSHQQEPQQRSYNDDRNYNQPMSPVQYQNDYRSDSPYQRQTSVGSNRSDTNNYPQTPQSHFKKPTPFSPGYTSAQNGTSTPPRLQRQTSTGNGHVYESTISPGFQPGSFLPKSDEAPPPPPPPTNYQPEQYRRPSYDQDTGSGQYQRQSSQNRGYNQHDPRQDSYNSYQQRPNQGMYVDTSSQPPYQRQGSRPYESSGPAYQQPPTSDYYDNKRNEVQSPSTYQRQPSYGSQQQQYQAPPPPPPPPQQQQQYGSPYTQPQQYNRQSSRGQNQEPSQYTNSNYPGSPQSGSGINSFEDILSPFEKFQNSNYCDKLFDRSADNRDIDSGVMSDYQSQSLSSDTPRSNQSSSYSGYSPPQTYQGGYDAANQQSQSLLRPAPPAPPPPSVTPPPPPPPPPPTNWAPPQSYRKPETKQAPGEEGQMPDKVLNTMMKNQGQPKPFSYVPTGMDLKAFKEKARKRNQPRPVMPRGYVGADLDTDDSPAEPQAPQVAKPKPPGGAPSPGTGVYKHAQYNSPLRMYSDENAKKEFNIQSRGEVDVSGVNNSTPERRPSDIKESEVYKMVAEKDAQGYKPRKPRNPLLRHNSEDDEMRFTGLHSKADIPSKAFQRLNKLALTDSGNASDDVQASTQENENGEPDRIGNYDEASIRYRGNHIPSPSFRLLQSLAKTEDARSGGSNRGATDEEDDGLPDQLDAEDMVDKRYKGSNIPSKSFKALQMYTSDDKPAEGTPGGPGGPKIKVVSRGGAMSPRTTPKSEAHPSPPIKKMPVENPSTDF